MSHHIPDDDDDDDWMIVMMKVMMKNNLGAALISLPSAYILAQLYHGNGCLETLSLSWAPSDWETW